MTLGDRFLYLLIAEYIVVSGLYLLSGNWVKSMYFLGAAILSVAVVLMK